MHDRGEAVSDEACGVTTCAICAEAGSGKTIAQVHNGVCGECALARVRKRARSVSVRETDRCARERSLDKDEFHQTVSTRQRVWTSLTFSTFYLCATRRDPRPRPFAFQPVGVAAQWEVQWKVLPNRSPSQRL